MLLLLWISCVVVDATEKDQACLQQISEMVLYQNLLRYVYLSDCMHNRTFYLETIEKATAYLAWDAVTRPLRVKMTLLITRDCNVDNDTLACRQVYKPYCMLREVDGNTDHNMFMHKQIEATPLPWREAPWSVFSDWLCSLLYSEEKCIPSAIQCPSTLEMITLLPRTL